MKGEGHNLFHHYKKESLPAGIWYCVHCDSFFWVKEDDEIEPYCGQDFRV